MLAVRSDKGRVLLELFTLSAQVLWQVFLATCVAHGVQPAVRESWSLTSPVPYVYTPCQAPSQNHCQTIRQTPSGANRSKTRT